MKANLILYPLGILGGITGLLYWIADTLLSGFEEILVIFPIFFSFIGFLATFLKNSPKKGIIFLICGLEFKEILLNGR